MYFVGNCFNWNSSASIQYLGYECWRLICKTFLATETKFTLCKLNDAEFVMSDATKNEFRDVHQKCSINRRRLSQNQHIISKY